MHGPRLIINLGGIKMICAKFHADIINCGLTMCRCTFMRFIGGHIGKYATTMEPNVIFDLA